MGEMAEYHTQDWYYDAWRERRSAITRAAQVLVALHIQSADELVCDEAITIALDDLFLGTWWDQPFDEYAYEPEQWVHQISWVLGHTWKPQSQGITAIARMEDAHLVNTILYVDRQLDEKEIERKTGSRPDSPQMLRALDTMQARRELLYRYALRRGLKDLVDAGEPVHDSHIFARAMENNNENVGAALKDVLDAQKELRDGEAE